MMDFEVNKPIFNPPDRVKLLMILLLQISCQLLNFCSSYFIQSFLITTQQVDSISFLVKKQTGSPQNNN